MKFVEEIEDRIELDTIQGESHEMGIELNAKAFQILSANLYKNKVRAVIRELSTNAWDAHVDAGTEDVPFDVQLPTLFDNTFRIRDYGTGMDEKTIFEVFNCMFRSTKTDTNKATGMLGLGSKTPFAYTDQVTWVSYTDGVKKVYNSLVGASGRPSMRLVHAEETDEPNGLEIMFTVDSEDCYNFESEAKIVYPWFRRGAMPKFLNTNLKAEDLHAKLEKVADNAYIMRDSTCFPSTEYSVYVIQGNVAYPLEDKFMSPEVKEVSNALNPKPSGYGYTYGQKQLLFLEVPIGTVDFVPSREQLTGSEANYERINPHIENLMEQFLDHYRKEMVDVHTDLQALKYRYENRDSLNEFFFNKICKEKDLDVRFKHKVYNTPDFTSLLHKLGAENSHIDGKPTGRDKWGHDNLFEIDMRAFIDKDGKKTGEVRKRISCIDHDKVMSTSAYLSLVLVDDTKRYRSKMKNYFSSTSRFIVLKNSDEYPDLVTKLEGALGHLCKVVRTSDMPDVYKQRAKNGNRTRYRWFNNLRLPMGSKDLKTLDDMGVDPDEEFYYVKQHNNHVCGASFGHFSRDVFKKMFHAGLVETEQLVAIALSRDEEKLQKAFPNAKPLFETVKEAFEDSYTRDEMAEEAVFSQSLWKYSDNFDKLNKIFAGLDDEEILEYNLGEEFIKARDGMKGNVYDAMIQIVNVRAIFQDLPTSEDSYGSKYIDTVVDNEYPIIDSISSYRITGKIPENLRAMLRK